ncbi:MAG: hypothetical protein JNN15_11415 [Blastocatellia bacterium]|nr:hypothetical protein [Blastocatellia bacterium]
MEQEQKVLVASKEENVEDAEIEQSKEGFFRRAFKRTKEAIRNVDEAITNREAFKRIEDKFEKQEELNQGFNKDISSAVEKTELFEKKFDAEISKLLEESLQQRTFFELTSTEIKITAEKLTTAALSAEKTLENAKLKQGEIERLTSEQLTKWNNDSETLRRDVKLMQEQIAQLQNSFKQFLITAAIAIALLVLVILYLLLK